MENFIIITGHGSYASGISGFIKMIAGDIKGIAYIDFTENCSVDILHDIYQKKIESHDKESILVLCDIVGGTPFKEAARCAVIYKNVEVVAGMSPIAILEACFLKESLDIEALIAHLIESTKNGILRFQPSLEEQSYHEHSYFETGI